MGLGGAQGINSSTFFRRCEQVIKDPQKLFGMLGSFNSTSFTDSEKLNLRICSESNIRPLENQLSKRPPFVLRPLRKPVVRDCRNAKAEPQACGAAQFQCLTGECLALNRSGASWDFLVEYVLTVRPQDL